MRSQKKKNQPLIQFLSAGLHVMGEDVDPKKVEAVLGIPPSNSAKKGDPLRHAAKGKFPKGFYLAVFYPGSRPTKGHYAPLVESTVARLAKSILPHRRYLRGLAKKADVWISLVFYFCRGMEGVYFRQEAGKKRRGTYMFEQIIGLEPRTLSLLGKIGLPVYLTEGTDLILKPGEIPLAKKRTREKA